LKKARRLRTGATTDSYFEFACGRIHDRFPRLQTRHAASPHRPAHADQAFGDVARILRYLQLHGEELRAQHEDVLIGVTRFFRDPEPFDILKSAIFPRTFENLEPGQQVRIWSAGCSPVKRPIPSGFLFWNT
jgi:chemotaxis methyl-accepting protein methylase